jgi:RimJ/RimL family protein N-acetyltransferase
MSHPADAAWPPPTIVTERLILREPESKDRAALIELFTSPEVGTYIGGPRPREEFERSLPEDNRRPGLFAVELNGALIGIVTLDRPERERKGHIRLAGDETNLGYLFLPEAWGCGYATEACAAVLNWFTTARPGESVALSTQTANRASIRLATKLGFTEVERYEAYGAEQWLGVWSPSRQRR